MGGREGKGRERREGLWPELAGTGVEMRDDREGKFKYMWD